MNNLCREKYVRAFFLIAPNTKTFVIAKILFFLLCIILSPRLYADRLQEEILNHTKEAQVILDQLQAIGDVTREGHLLSQLKTYGYTEVYDGLVAKIREHEAAILKDSGSKLPEIRLIVEIFDTLSHIGTKSQVGELKQLMNELEKTLAKRGKKFSNEKGVNEILKLKQSYKKMLVQVTQRNKESILSFSEINQLSSDNIVQKLALAEELGENSVPLPNEIFKAEKDSTETDVQVGPIKIDETKSRFKEFILERQMSEIVNYMNEYLSARVIDNPDLISRAMMLLASSYANPGKKMSLLMMGPPGTGKDTFMKSYIRGLHGDYLGVAKQHMYSLQRVKDKQDYNAELGSAAGYIGSQNGCTEALQFLVNHSGGKYLLFEQKDGGCYAIENPAWEGVDLPGYFPANSGIFVLNEFHNWSKNSKDYLFKDMKADGIFPIPNQGKGVKSIVLPDLTLFIATNEGTELVFNRNSDGSRNGPRIDHEESKRNWEKNYQDTAVKKDALMASNELQGESGEGAAGMSEEVLNRFSEREMALMHPLSPAGLRIIVGLQLQQLKEELIDGPLGPIDITWNKEWDEFIQAFDYDSEAQGRPIEENINSLFWYPILQAFISEQIPEGSEQKIMHLSMSENQDFSLKVIIDCRVIKEDFSIEKYTIEIPIEATRKLVPRQPLQDMRVNEILDMPNKINQKIFGLKSFVTAIAKRLLKLEDRKEAEHGRHAAQSMLFLGMTGLGKSQLLKDLAEVFFKKKDAYTQIDMAGITSTQDIDELFYGKKDVFGAVVMSPFMKAYDRSAGFLFVHLSEIANTNSSEKNLKYLYDLVDEPHPMFADEKDRPMDNVYFVMSGNALSEDFEMIPTNIPNFLQMEAMNHIYNRLVGSRELRLAGLQKYFSDPLIARIGEANIYIFPPLTYKTSLEVTQQILIETFNGLKAKDSKRGWNLLFSSPQEFKELAIAIREDSFVPKYQARSIKSFIQDVFESELHYVLSKELIPSGSNIRIALKSITAVSKEGLDPLRYNNLAFELKVEGRNSPILMTIKGKDRNLIPKDHLSDLLLVGLHEAGHEIVGQTYMSDSITGRAITIIEGFLKERSGNLFHYKGLQIGEENYSVPVTRQNVLYAIATKAGGFVAQRLVTANAIDDAGKANDLAKMSFYSNEAILRWGLSDTWGQTSLPDETDLFEYINHMPPKMRELFEKEKATLINEGIALATKALRTNMKTLLVMGKTLVEKGELYTPAIAAIYADTGMIYNNQKGFGALNRTWTLENIKSRLGKFSHRGTEVAQAQLLSFVIRPKSYALQESLAKEKKLKEYGEVKIPEEVPLINRSFDFTTVMSCLTALK